MRPLCLILILSACAPGVAAEPDSYLANAKPFVDQFCIACHNARKDSGGLNMAVYGDVKSLWKDRTVWENVKRRVALKEMPPKNKPAPNDAERRQFVAWLDAELKKAPLAPATPGRVTMRRLNRVEYNRTVQDLCGIEFRPADDFPSDDVGHGFDNIGDVLSMPPILLEKYLTAAEKIVELTINGETVIPVTTRYTAEQLRPTGTAEIARRGERPYRKLDTAGSVYVDHKVAAAGELTVRARAFGDPFPGNRKIEAVRLAFELDGKQFGNQRLPSNTPTGIEAKVRVTPGTHRIGITLLNPSDKDTKEEKRTLGVFGFEIIDPIAVSAEKPASYQRVMIGDPKDESRQRAERIIANFARRAYRRPPAGDELPRLMKLYDLGKKEGESFDKSVGFALQAILVSPHFLFRVEPDAAPDRPDGSYALNSWQIASRLSYFLWSTMPDDELFRLAEQGQLRDPMVLEMQVSRMLKDDRVNALVQNFGGQWLNLRNLATAQPAKRDFPLWDESLRAAMRTETEMFLLSIIREDRSILDLIDADYTFVNGRLARHYGIEGIRGEPFQRVKLADRNRGGVLTQASVLTVTSNPTRTSPVKRGKWIMENILGTPPPPPPPNVPELKEDKDAVLKGSLRERMQQHRANPNCATCHEHMDTLGFGFENFDAIGGWRTEDGSFKINSAGTLPDGSEFRTPAELKRLLKRDDELFRRCLVEKMMTYALGRGIDQSDRVELERVSKAVAADRNRFNRMVLEIVKGDAFLRRTVKK